MHSSLKREDDASDSVWDMIVLPAVLLGFVGLGVYWLWPKKTS